LQLHILENLEDLATSADRWNDLWQRSDSASPSARAQQLALWVETFARAARFSALMVEDAGRLVAALPLVRRRMKRVLSVGALPLCEWSAGGDLLIDPDCDTASALDQLARGAARRGWPLLWCEHVPRDEPRWQQLAAALSRAGWSVDFRDQTKTAQTFINHDWASYEAGLRGEFRRSRKRYARRLEESGKTALIVTRPTEPAEVDKLVRTAFEVEDRSWKGTQGTSVLKNDGMLEFFQRQARLLAADGQLEIVLLEHEGTPIASAYVWAAKGVRFTAKVGYDEAFRAFGPGQYLMMRYLERLHADPDCRVVDYWGPLMQWSLDWSTRVYTTARLVAAPPRLHSRGLFSAYSHFRRPRAATRSSESNNQRQPEKIAVVNGQTGEIQRAAKGFQLTELNRQGRQDAKQ
jgi:CelD/BcsL family acetyltransferase involved in cellulose biosynthesis